MDVVALIETEITDRKTVLMIWIRCRRADRDGNHDLQDSVDDLDSDVIALIETEITDLQDSVMIWTDVVALIETEITDLQDSVDDLIPMSSR